MEERDISTFIEDAVEIHSTSSNTADVSTFILHETDRIRLSFQPRLVNNPKDNSKCVSGKIVYEQKRKSAESFPTESVTRGDIRVGEYMEIPFDTTETKNLLLCLQKCYELYDKIGTIPFGDTTYTRVNHRISSILSAITKDPALYRQLVNEETRQLITQLLAIALETDSIDSVREVLSTLEEKGLSRLHSAINIEKLCKIKALLEENMQNDREEFWQTTFTDNQWILSQIFGSPLTIYGTKLYLGGKGLDNKGGKVCDFLYRNNLSGNIAIIEIKTPCVNIIGPEYRQDVYPPSTPLSGSVSQVLSYKDAVQKEYYQLFHDEPSMVFNPQCVVVIGCIKDLSPTQVASFELFRSSLNGVIIITFDELLERINQLIKVMTESENKHADPLEHGCPDETKATSMSDGRFDDIPF